MLHMIDKDQDGYNECIGHHHKTQKGLFAYRMPEDITDQNTGELYIKKGDSIVTLESALEEMSRLVRQLENTKIMVQALR